MKLLFTIIVASLLFIHVNAQQDSIRPALFLPGIVSTGYNERDLAISPDGDDMFYTVQSPRISFSVILHRKKRNGHWQAAETAWFSGMYQDLEPAYSPDGNRLFFVSNRPLALGGKPKDFDIWYMDKKNGKWLAPVNAGPQVNTANNEFYPSITQSGAIYFTAIRADTLGQEDIYKSEWKNGRFEAPANIGDSVNSIYDEYNAFIDPEERYIIFSVEGDIENYMGRGDLCISYRNPQGGWTKATSLGTKVNSARLDYCPFVYHDTFYFTSERIASAKNQHADWPALQHTLNAPGNGFGDIYTMPLRQILSKAKLQK